MDTPRSVVPGSEWGQLQVSGGLSLPVITSESQEGGLSAVLSSLASLLAIQHLGPRANESLREETLQYLPGNVSRL